MTHTADQPPADHSPGKRRALGLNPSNLVEARLKLDKLQRVGTDSIVSINGVQGVFTPIGTADDQVMGADERKNLLAIIDQLKREVARLQQENLAFKERLSLLTQRPAAPDDFASAVQQSVDELQQRLATLRNSTSNFAVRQLKLDASFFVQVSPLGTIEYRFIQPGDDIEAAAVSRLSLEIVPLPRNDLAGVWLPGSFQPELAVSALPEITAEQISAVEGTGIYSIGEFLQVATRARAQAYLEALLGVERKQLALWAQQAALMLLRGVNGAAAVLLINAGIGSFDALASLLPEEVVSRYMTQREKEHAEDAPEIDSAVAERWIAAARRFLGLADAG